MKHSYRFSHLLLTLLVVFSGQVYAAGLLKPVNSQLPDLQVIEHHVDVVIEDGYATTTVEQVFRNPNNQNLEAVYSFPVPEKAAVGEFIYWINGNPVIGEVVEKQQAREVYEQQKQAGQQASLVEKDAYKTFDISIAQVMPQSDVRIRLVYLQPAHVDTGIGRYVYPLEEGGVDEAKLAFWSRNEQVLEQFSFNLSFRSSYPIDALRLPNHPNAKIDRVSDKEWNLSLSNSRGATNQDLADNTGEAQGLSGSDQRAMPVAFLDKDILVYWRHVEGLPAALDLLAYRSSDGEERSKAAGKGTFMLTLTPGDDLAPLQEGRDWVFILDISGSMQGKFATLVEGVRQGLGKLSPLDRFRVVMFNSRATDFSGGFQPVTPQSVEAVLNRLENFQPQGSTNLYAGLKMGLNHLDSDRSAAIILVTDGVANVGVTEKKAFLRLLEKQDVRLFTFIMGNSANRPLLEGMAQVSNGFAQSISNADDIVGQLMLATGKMTHQALRDVELKFKGNRVTDVTPSRINSLYRGQQLVVFGHYWQGGDVEVELTGRIAGENRRYQTRFVLPDNNNRNPELERLWAFAQIESLQTQLDYFGASADTEQAITDVALEYGLVTDYTSMLVVDDAVFKALGIDRNNQTRVLKEQAARELRKQQDVQDNRVDQAQPMFSQPRAGVGGGAVGPWALLLMLVLFVSGYRKFKAAQ
jgi:Ca-activated chloride channel family protein